MRELDILRRRAPRALHHSSFVNMTVCARITIILYIP